MDSQKLHGLIKTLLTAINSVTQPYDHGALINLNALNNLRRTQLEAEKLLFQPSELEDQDGNPLQVDLVKEGEDG